MSGRAAVERARAASATRSAHHRHHRRARAMPDDEVEELMDVEDEPNVPSHIAAISTHSADAILPALNKAQTACHALDSELQPFMVNALNLIAAAMRSGGPTPSISWVPQRSQWVDELPPTSEVRMLRANAFDAVQALLDIILPVFAAAAAAASSSSASSSAASAACCSASAGDDLPWLRGGAAAAASCVHAAGLRAARRQRLPSDVPSALTASL